MKYVAAAALLLCACAHPFQASSAADAHTYFSDGSAVFRQTTPKGEWVADVTLGQCENCDNASVLWWGADATPPGTIVSKFEVRFSGVVVLVPRSVYSDLANLRRGSVKSEGPKLTLTLEGGSGAAAYTALVTFKNKVIEGRQVFNKSFPQVRETTTYQRELPSDM
jgi:hypothetical protein